MNWYWNVVVSWLGLCSSGCCSGLVKLIQLTLLGSGQGFGGSVGWTGSCFPRPLRWGPTNIWIIHQIPDSTNLWTNLQDFITPHSFSTALKTSPALNDRPVILSSPARPSKPILVLQWKTTDIFWGKSCSVCPQWTRAKLSSFKTTSEVIIHSSEMNLFYKSMNSFHKTRLILWILNVSF